MKRTTKTMVKTFLQRFKHRHDVRLHEVKKAVFTDLKANFATYFLDDVSVVRLHVKCTDPKCKKDCYFIYDYDKGLIRFEDEALCTIDFNLGKVHFDFLIEVGNLIFTNYNIRSYEQYIKTKAAIVGDLSAILATKDDTALTNHISWIENITVTGNYITEIYVENATEIALDYRSLRDLHNQLYAKFGQTFNMTITYI